MVDSHHTPSSADAEIRAKALEALLIEKGLITTDLIDEVVRQYEEDIGPLNGARVIARAWTNASFKEWLLRDGTAAIADMGYYGLEGSKIVVLENTASIHNLVVCTLCSCYPWPVLGLPPNWYKSYAYRARAVREPRKVLEEFGLLLDDDVEVRVWDSNSEVRYLVLPERPSGTEQFDIEQLTAIVSRDAMIGVARIDEL
jgi:nitrile hydratase